MKTACELFREGRKRLLTLRVPMVIPLLPRDCIVLDFRCKSEFPDKFARMLLLSETFSPVPDGMMVPEYTVPTDLAPGVVGHWARDSIDEQIPSGLEELLYEHAVAHFDDSRKMTGTIITRAGLQGYPAPRPAERSIRQYMPEKMAVGIVFKADFFLPTEDAGATDLRIEDFAPEIAAALRDGATLEINNSIGGPCEVRLVPPVDCPDCYIGLGGQVEHCERHRG